MDQAAGSTDEAPPALAAERLLDASPDAVLVVDAAGVIRHCTGAVGALFGYRPGELTGQSVEVLVPESLRTPHVGNRTRFMADPVTRSMGAGLELLGQRKDGSTVPVDIALAPVGGPGEVMVAAFVRDAREGRRTRTLLSDVNQISAELLAGRPAPAILRLVAARARSLVGAVCAWVVVPIGGDRLAVVAVDSDMDVDLVGAGLSRSGSHSGRAMASSRPISIPNLSEDPLVMPEAQGLGLGPGVYLPMVSDEGPVGALVVARSAGEDQFSHSELEAAQTFAAAAGVVLALGRARTDLEELQLTSEHERIARDLHDTVIQRLFAVGMGLQSVQRLAPSPVSDRIESAVEALDGVIREIRETIFDLNRPSSALPDLRQRVNEVVREAADQLGFEPSVSYRGPVETALDEATRDHLLSVLREALSNAARHAKAGSAAVVIAVDEAFAILSVSDDGVGMAPDLLSSLSRGGPTAPSGSPTDAGSGGNGMFNMAERARQLGGRLDVRGAEGAGTVVEWRIPVSQA